jgi:hypothetical protein
MSGLEFHLQCSSCGLTSPTYPFRYDRVVEPTTVVLPVADRVHATFERVSISIEEKPDEAELAALAAARSTSDITVFVPHFGDDEDDVMLVPAAACPRCGNEPIAGRFGHLPQVALAIDDLAQAIDASRADRRGGSLSFRLKSPAAGIRCMRSADDGSVDWYVDRMDATDVGRLVEELRAKLIERGSRCDAAARFRAFARFREHPL